MRDHTDRLKPFCAPPSQNRVLSIAAGAMLFAVGAGVVGAAIVLISLL